MPNAAPDLLADFPIEIIDITRLKPHPRNYKQHPDDQLEHIVKLVKEHGIYKNIVISRDDFILAGHGVVLAARKLKMRRVPVRRLPIDHDDPRAIKVLVGDNEISHLAERDDRLLSELLKSIQSDETTELQGTGFDEQMLANLVFVTRPASEIQDFDEAAEWVGLPDYEQAPTIFKLVISFDSEAHRDELMQKVGIPKPHGKARETWSAWYPPRDREDLVSVRFEDEQPQAEIEAEAS